MALPWGNAGARPAGVGAGAGLKEQQTPGRPSLVSGLDFEDEAGKRLVTRVLEGPGSCPELPDDQLLPLPPPPCPALLDKVIHQLLLTTFAPVSSPD